MSTVIRRYFKRRDGLPDPKGSLSASQAIALANREVEKTMEAAKVNNRGPYVEHSPKVRSDIGRYARLHGSSAAATYVSRKFRNKVSVNTVHSIKKAYEEEAKTKLEADSDDEVKVIPFNTHRTDI